MRLASDVVVPGARPESIRACFIHPRSVSGTTPTLGPIRVTAAFSDNSGSSAIASLTRRIARSRNSCGYFLGAGMTPTLSRVQSLHNYRGGSGIRMRRSMSRESTRADAATKPHEGDLVSTGTGLREWIENLPTADHPVSVATFDTKVRHPRLPGSAAKAASKALKARGYRLIAAPETFDVDGTTGPLLDGETDRPTAWAARLKDVSRR